MSPPAKDVVDSWVCVVLVALFFVKRVKAGIAYIRLAVMLGSAVVGFTSDESGHIGDPHIVVSLISVFI